MIIVNDFDILCFVIMFTNLTWRPCLVKTLGRTVKIALVAALRTIASLFQHVALTYQQRLRTRSTIGRSG